MTRGKVWLGVSLVVLIAVVASFAAPIGGWSFITSTTADQVGCTLVTTNVLCVVPATTGAQLWASLNGGTLVQLYPQSGTAPVASVNGKTGAVSLGFSDLASKPSQIAVTCPAASIGASGLVSGTCTISLIQ